MGALNYMIAVELGGTILHTCSRPLANGPSLPSTEQTVANLDRLGLEHGIDETALPPVADHCARIARQEGWLVGEPAEFDTFAYQHHLPGGMTGTLKAQLAQYSMAERLPEVLEETVRVREELGHPISATPFSQLVGIQSVLNVVTGDRWSVVPDEVVLYLMEKFGPPPAPIDAEVRDRVLSSPHGQRFAGWERPQPTLAGAARAVRRPVGHRRGAAAALHGARRRRRRGAGAAGVPGLRLPRRDHRAGPRHRADGHAAAPQRARLARHDVELHMERD